MNKRNTIFGHKNKKRPVVKKPEDIKRPAVKILPTDVKQTHVLKKLDVIIVSVDYNDYLILSLEHNRKFFENITVVTTSDDEMCQKICKKFGVNCVITNRLHEDESSFNKGKAINDGIKSLHNPDFILILDADIIVDKDLDLTELEDDVVYTSDRWICFNKFQFNRWKTGEVSNQHLGKYEENKGFGFFHLFKFDGKLYPENYKDASNCDLIFRDSFRSFKKIETNAIHLGDVRKNWSGRVSEKFIQESEILEILNKKSTFKICSYYYNYRGDIRQKNNFIKFLEQWKGYYDKLVVGLVDYEDGDLDFDIPCEKIIIKGDKENKVWSKEILINKILDEVDTDYFMWIDGDIIYENLDWLNNLDTIIGNNDFVQLFENINYLGKNGEILETHKSTSSHSKLGVDALVSMGYKPGGAWLGRTSILKKKRFFEKMYVGGGDMIFAYGLFSENSGKTLELVKEANLEIYQEALKWINEFGKYKFGFLKEDVSHLYHGDLSDRNYNGRYINLKTKIDNYIDVRPNICLIYDADGWIFQSKSNSIKNILGDFYNFDIIKWDSDIITEKYDIVLCYSPSCLPKAKIPVEKIICGISSHIYNSSNKKLFNFRYNFSNDIKLYNDLKSEKKFYAPNGVDTDFFNYRPKSIKGKNLISIAAVGSSGRSIHKGEERLKIITERLNKKKNQVVNKSLYVNAKSDDKLTKEQMRDYYKDIDILIVSSVSEATPNPLLEAMSMYTPCVTNNTGMAKLLIDDGVNGFIIENYDDIDSYVNNIQKIIDNEDLYEKFSINSRKMIENYDWRKTIVNYKIMFDDFIKDKIEKETTILIKTFNRPNSLFNQIRSIRSIYKNIEILIVNDGDEEIEIIESNIRVINTNFDIGLSAGRNLGIKNIRTKYFVLCDDDFEFTPQTKIEIFWSILEKSDLDIIGGLVNSNGFKMGIFKEYKINEKNILEVKNGYLEKNNLFYRCDYIRNFFMSKTNLFKEENLEWDERLKMGEHTLFYYSLWKRNKIKIGITHEVSVNNRKEIPTKEYEYMRLRSQWFTDHYIRDYGIDTIIINKKIRNQAHE